MWRSGRALLFLSCLKVKECFVVIETEDLFRAAGQNTGDVQQIVDTFGKIFEEVTKNGNTMKLLLVSYGVRSTLPNQSGHSAPIVASLSPPLPVVRRNKQPLVQQFKLGSGRNQLRPRLTA